MVSVYEELALDLLTTCELGIDQARAIVTFLKVEGFVDYDQLEEYYLPEEDTDN